ncbi:transposase [Acetobacter senegalensis]|nr:transposase [Acetobacter senegalensis]
MSRRFWFQPSSQAISSCSTISAATRAVRFVRPFGLVGAKNIFLPPYSPDLNPIEQVFAKLKTLLRKAAEQSVETIWKRIGSLLQCFSPHVYASKSRMSGKRKLAA